MTDLAAPVATENPTAAAGGECRIQFDARALTLGVRGRGAQHGRVCAPTLRGRASVCVSAMRNRE
eukprot:4010564-Pleurochrysis_carterae.AAC.1